MKILLLPVKVDGVYVIFEPSLQKVYFSVRIPCQRTNRLLVMVFSYVSNFFLSNFQLLQEISNNLCYLHVHCFYVCIQQICKIVRKSTTIRASVLHVPHSENNCADCTLYFTLNTIRIL